MSPRDNFPSVMYPTTTERRGAERSPESFGETQVGPLFPLPAVLRQFGADPARVLRSVGIDPRIFESPDNRLSLERVGLLLRACVEATGQLHFGLLVGRQFECSMLGVLGYLVRHQPTVRAALRTLVLQLHLHDRGAVAALDESSGRHAELSYAICTPGTPETGLIHGAVMMVGFRLLKILGGENWRPIEVRIAQGAPSDAAIYREMFESKVRFDRPLSAIVFERRWLDVPIPDTDPELLRLLTRMAAAIDGRLQMSLSQRVRRVLRTSVLAGTANTRRLAEMFSLSERGLRRHLAREGVALNDLIGEARLMVAQQLLEQTRLSLNEIAGVLHYADPSAFSRAFRGWTQDSPSAWRKAALGRTPPPQRLTRVALQRR